MYAFIDVFFGFVVVEYFAGGYAAGTRRSIGAPYFFAAAIAPKYFQSVAVDLHTDGVVDAGVGDNTKFEAELLGGGGSMAISDFARTVVGGIRFIARKHTQYID